MTEVHQSGTVSTSPEGEAVEQQPESMLERFHKASTLSESSPTEAITLFQQLQEDVAARSIFSSNEGLEDISSRSLVLLSIEHQLAMTYLRLPTGPANIADRLQHLTRACDLWASFLSHLEQFELLSADDRKQYEQLVELSDHASNGNSTKPPPPTNRDAKIARFKAKQANEREREQLRALMSRRSRLGVATEEEMDGHDEESLERTMALKTIEICKLEAMEEWSSTLREMPMIRMMVQSQQERQGQDRHKGATASGPSRPAPPRNAQPLQVTRVTKDAGTGQLMFQRHEIRSQVFRPGWNQPTMSLQELGERELQQALEREERQKESEAARKLEPRRYEQLAKDGLEDNADLVDASAALDRNWDDFKDENPRGSGNKRGDVGDRNF